MDTKSVDILEEINLSLSSRQEPNGADQNVLTVPTGVKPVETDIVQLQMNVQKNKQTESTDTKVISELVGKKAGKRGGNEIQLK